MPLRSLRRTNTGTSTSLLFGNLASNGKHVACIHNAEVMVLSDSTVTSGSASPSVLKLSDMNLALVQQVRWVQLPEAEVFVVASQRSLQLYSADQKRLLHHLVSLPTASPEVPSYFKGISGGVLSHGGVVCAGCSSGAVCVLPVFEQAANFGEVAYYQVGHIMWGQGARGRDGGA